MEILKFILSIKTFKLQVYVFWGFVVILVIICHYLNV